MERKYKAAETQALADNDPLPHKVYCQVDPSHPPVVVAAFMACGDAEHWAEFRNEWTRHIDQNKFPLFYCELA